MWLTDAATSSAAVATVDNLVYIKYFCGWTILSYFTSFSSYFAFYFFHCCCWYSMCVPWDAFSKKCQLNPFDLFQNHYTKIQVHPSLICRFQENEWAYTEIFCCECFELRALVTFSIHIWIFDRIHHFGLSYLWTVVTHKNANCNFPLKPVYVWTLMKIHWYKSISFSLYVCLCMCHVLSWIFISSIHTHHPYTL